MEDIRYPVGRFVQDREPTAEKRAAWIRDIADMPAALSKAIDGLSQDQLDHPYRDGGWTPRQIVHHLADSHMNAFVRFKLALTEPAPQIKPYDQDAWARLPDVLKADPASSLAIIKGLHERFVVLLSSLGAKDFDTTFLHPENGPMTLDRTLQTYAWHSRHHVAQIAALRERMGWKPVR
jgi:uncharacterized damage-inducible protein DinB